MSAERPDWLAEPCPAWCDGEHDGQELEADRRHHSIYRVVPVIQPEGRWPRRGHRVDDRAEADELNVIAFRDVGARESWVAFPRAARGEPELDVMRARPL